jgi:hypothetical protein
LACLLIAGGLLVQDFDGDLATELGVFGPVDLAHPAQADLVDDAIVQDRLSGVERAHGDASTLRGQPVRCADRRFVPDFFAFCEEVLAEC